jgi:cytochrome c-type biogenesis protein CcmH
MKGWWVPVILLLGMHAQAAEVRQFDDPAKQQRYENLIKELRCLVCQNQSLADSDADLAQDLRDEVYAIIQSGKDEREAIIFLTDRYGDFVRYRPPLKASTALLWAGPFILLAGGGWVLWRLARRRATRETHAGLSPEERARLQQLKDKLQG